MGWGQRVDPKEGPIQDDPTLDNFNAEYKANVLIEQIQGIANGTASNHNVMIMMGDDFEY